MTPHPQPDIVAEEARLASLRRMLSIGGPTADDYVRTVRMARHCLDVPIAYVSIIDDECQCMAAVMGIQSLETPREHSLCGRAVEAGQVVACPDTLAAPEFAANPVVLQAPYVRSFIAQPLRSAEGQYVGALCVADTVARQWTGEQLQVMADVAFGLEALIALRFLAGSHGLALGRVAHLAQEANTDALTGLLNRRGITDMVHHAYTRCHLEGRGFGLAIIDLDHFKRVNDTYGHDAGDAALAVAARRLASAVRGQDLAGRWGGEEFLAVLPGVARGEMEALGARLVAALAGMVQHGERAFMMTASVGLAWDGASAQVLDLPALLAAADEALYQAKHAGRNRAILSGKTQHTEALASAAPAKHCPGHTDCGHS